MAYEARQLGRAVSIYRTPETIRPVASRNGETTGLSDDSFAAGDRLTGRPGQIRPRQSVVASPDYRTTQAVKYFTPLVNSGWSLSPGTLTKVPSVYRSE